MKKKIAYFAIFSAFCSLLAGCATLLPQQSYQTQQSTLKALSHWRASGQFSLHYQKQNTTSFFHWKTAPDTSTIRFFGPFGQTEALLSLTPAKTTLRTANGKQYSAHKPSTLLQQQLGWKIPVKPLQHWLMGLESPQWPAKKTLDDQHRLKTLQQAGWVIRYNDYTVVQQHYLPTSLTLTHAAHDIRLKIIVSRWHLG